MTKYRILFFIVIYLDPFLCLAQNGKIAGVVQANGTALPYANIFLVGTGQGTVSDSSGFFHIDQLDTATYYEVKISMIGYQSQRTSVLADASSPARQHLFNLQEESTSLSEIVVTGSKRPVSRMESPVQ